jgi:hypothetical protein
MIAALLMRVPFQRFSRALATPRQACGAASDMQLSLCNITAAAAQQQSLTVLNFSHPFDGMTLKSHSPPH